MNNTATNTATCPTVRKQIGKTTYIVRVHFSETAKETMEDKIKRLLREEVRHIHIFNLFYHRLLLLFLFRLCRSRIRTVRILSAACA